MSTGLATRVARWLKNSQLVVLPGTCVLCRRPSGRPRDLCGLCHAQLRTIEAPCRGCGLPCPDRAGTLCGPCLATPGPIARTIAPLCWEAPVSGLISAFKYQGRLPAGRALTLLLADAVRAGYAGEALPALLLPVPLHRRRLAGRGYNQAALMANWLGQALDLPVHTGLLQRTRHTPAQQALSAARRRANLRGAFRVAPGRAQALSNCFEVAVIDDVVTTMTTANTLASMLQGHLPPGSRVHLWALARA